MFIPLDVLIVISIFIVLGCFGMRIYYLNQINDYYEMYSEKNEMCISLSKELCEYKKKEITKGD